MPASLVFALVFFALGWSGLALGLFMIHQQFMKGN